MILDVNILDKVLVKIKIKIGIGKFDDTEKLIDTDNKLADKITLKNIVILISRIIKDDDNFYPKLFLEEALE